MVELNLSSQTRADTRLSDAARVWLVAAGLIGLLLLPLAVIEVPPLLDYPNHLARAHILASINQDLLLAERYQVTWRALPNLGFDLVVSSLTPFTGVYVAGRIFLALTIVLSVIGPLVFHRALYGRYAYWPLACGLLAYNGAFMAGFAGFAFGLGLAFLFSGLWLRLRAESPLLGLLAGMVFAVLTYFAHLFALGLFGLIAGSVLFDKWRRSARRWPPERAVLSEGVALAFQFSPVILLYLATKSSEGGGIGPWNFAQKLNFTSYVVTGMHSSLPVVFGATLALLGLWHLFRSGRLRLHPALLPATVVLGLLWLIPPSHFLDTAFVAERFFLALLFITIAASRLDSLSPRAGRWLFFGLAAATTVRILFLTAQWQEADHAGSELRAALNQVERGAVLHSAFDIPAYLDAIEKDDALPRWAVSVNRIPALTHFGGLAAIDRSAFVPLLFTHPEKQLLRAHPDFGPIDLQQGLPWSVEILPVEARRARASLSGRADARHYVLQLHPGLWRERTDGAGDRIYPLVGGRYLSLAGLLAKD